MTAHLTRRWDGLMAVLRGASTFVLAFMMITICYDAIMRYAFSAPTHWSLEINSFLLVYLAVMSAAEAQRRDAHIRIDYFKAKLPPRGQAVTGILTSLLGVAFCTIMAWRGGIMMLQAFEYNERVSSSLGTPIGIPYAMLPIGFGLLGLQFALDVWRESLRLMYPEDSDDNRETSSHG
ncbi:TRAP transporter small permease [Aidingimonas halophila]|uniref:TRAP transporter small permease protein n=1 Tax=Aidingimonas halophila TaxID=574349 RepID=A0A1H2UTL2_9GAMM|nr:TRAP transporter small permease [Aidingimonas halophila]GHC23197.1 hypothetical protein GCM10008094_12380 [Aidingimonas halophila]SDW59467.1 TRAP-type C4-dicarboxylate transport system, small permease component [Aidingimonas halophila]